VAPRSRISGAAVASCSILKARACSIAHLEQIHVLSTHPRVDPSVRHRPTNARN
jgi:hypothetical protein